MKLQSTMFVCITQRGEKNKTLYDSPATLSFPTPFCRCNWKPTSLKDLEQGLAQGGDNFYLIEKNQSYQEGTNCQSIGPTNQMRRSYSCYSSIRCRQMLKGTSQGLFLTEASEDWHWEPQEAASRDLHYQLIQFLRSPRRKHAEEVTCPRSPGH